MTSLRIIRRTVAPSTVYCKVDDSGGPITPGDTLIPSATTFGHAMRSTGVAAESTVIGTALVGFCGGCGLIPVAVSVEHVGISRVERRNRPGIRLYRVLTHG